MMQRFRFSFILSFLNYVLSNSLKPNLVILLADDLGYGDVGCFGNTSLPTPNIDRLAQEGVKLTQHLATSGVCTPSRASFMTSRYAIRMGMVPSSRVRVGMFVGSTGGLNADEITFAELAKDKNYSTAFIGKWHLGMHGSNSQDFAKSPMNQGFDYFYGLPLTNLKDFGDTGEKVILRQNPYSEQIIFTVVIVACLATIQLYKWRPVYGCCFAAFLALPLILATAYFWLAWFNLHIFSGMVFRNREVVEQPVDLSTITKRLVNEGTHFLEERSRDQQPFLLVMSWLQVHTALHASPKFRGKSAHGDYGDEVLELDSTIGQILNALDKHGFTQNTLVYMSSDQGGHTEERGLNNRVEGGYNGIFRGGKAMGGWEGGIRVPTLMRWPGVFPAGSSVDVATSQMDLMPTLAAAMDVSMPTDRPIDGVNLLPLLKQENTELIPHEFLFHYCGDSVHAARWTPSDGSSDIWKIHFITPNWLPGTEQCHYVCQCFGHFVTVHEHPLLFNLAQDPGERQPCSPQTACGARTYDDVIGVVRKAVDRFSASVEPVESQYAWYNLVPRPWLQPCCNFPYCSCKEKVIESQ